MRRWMAIGLVLAVPVLSAAQKPGLPAQYAKNLERPATAALGSAARFLVASQADLKAPDGPAVLRATWPFEVGGEQAALNAAGLVALGLLAAHHAGAAAESLRAAQAWGRARLRDLEAGLPAFDPDVEALAALARATGDPALMAAARAAFEQRHGGADGREIVERLFWVRRGTPALVGFDAALSMRAALSAGQEKKAREIASALETTAPRWNVPSKEGFDATGRAAVLEALAGLDAASGLKAALLGQVLGSQGADGSWATRNSQATAYSVRALAAVGGDGAGPAAARGRRFLRATQLKSGAWATFNDFLPEPFVGETVHEVTAEVMVALAR